MLTDPDQITPQWLTDRLRLNGHLAEGAVEQVVCGKSFESTAAFLTPLTVTYSGGAAPLPHTRLMLKRYRADWFGGGLAEAVFFNELAAQTPRAPVFRCYDFDSDKASRQCYFLFEDASATHTEDPPEDADSSIDLSRQIVDEITKFHVRWWEDPRIAQDDFTRGRGGPLRMADAATRQVTARDCAHWRDELLPAFAQKFGDALGAETHALLRRAVDVWEDLFGRRIADGKKLTLLHGDLHSWNIFYPRDPARHGLYLLDWETYKRGIGPYDLCYLVGNQPPEHRRQIETDLLRHYHGRLVQGGVSDYTWEDCLYDYRLAAVATLFPPLGWQSLDALNMRLEQFRDWRCEELLA